MTSHHGCLLIFLIFFSGLTLKAQVPPSQDFLWARNIGGTDLDWGYSVAVDASGSVYTTGTFSQTVDADPREGTVNLVSAGSRDVFISKLDADGNYVWGKRIGGGGSDGGKAIAVDNAGNVYIAGDFLGTVDFNPGVGTFNITSVAVSDLFICKLDTDGNFLWARNIGGTGEKAINSIAVDDAGNVYTTGFFNKTFDFNPGAGTYNMTSFPGSTTAGDIFISKLDVSGNFVWAKQLGGTDNEIGQDIAVDGNGNVYTTGFYRGTADFDPGASTFNLVGGGNEVFVSKLDASGNFVWAKSMGGTEGGDVGYSIALDASGNIYTTGSYFGTGDFDPGAAVFNLPNGGDNAFISKLDADGNFAWATSLGLPSGNAWSFGVAVDNDGNVYTTGDFSGRVDFDPGEEMFVLESSQPEIYVLKLDGAGNFVWAKAIVASTSDYIETGYSIAIDGSDNVLVTGYFRDSGDFDPSAASFALVSNGFNDAFILKLGIGVLVDPAITGFAPGSGNAGTKVTIAGTNFNTTMYNNLVKFNGKEATILSASATSLAVLVPFGATTGKISVTTAGGTAESTADFIVTPGFTVVSGLIKDIIEGPTNSITFYGEIVPFKDHVYFSVNAETPAQFELWRTDGSTEGTVLVSDNYHGNIGWDGNFTTVATENYIYFTEGDPRMLVAMDEDLNRIELTEYPSAYYTTGIFNGKFLFPSGINNTLHVFDEGTQSILELNNEVVPHRISRDNHYAYVYSNFNTRTALYRTDGTIAGTVLVHPGPIVVNAFMKAGADDYFAGQLNDNGGPKLFRTQGTLESTVPLTGVEGFFGIDGDLNGVLLMSADPIGNADVGNELYTVAGNSIVLVKDINEGSSSSLGTDINKQVDPVMYDNIFYFSATSATGQHLWRSDGTDTGTYIVKELFEYSNFLTIADNKIYFSGPQRRLWVTDGSESGTVEVPFPASMIHYITPHKGNLYFFASTPETGQELFVYNLADASTPPCNIPVPTIGVSGFTLSSSSPLGNQWLSEGAAIPGATGQTFTATQAGNYAVQVTVENCLAISDPVAVATTVTGIEEHDSYFHVYPNPASSILRIEFESNAAQGTVEIYTVIGTKKGNIPLLRQNGRLLGQLDVQAYPPGIYILRLRTPTGERRHRIEKL